jgi:hypothetical protein
MSSSHFIRYRFFSLVTKSHNLYGFIHIFEKTDEGLHENNRDQAPWLRPVILTIWEAAIRKIAVQSQPRQTAGDTVSQKYPTEKKD